MRRPLEYAVFALSLAWTVAYFAFVIPLTYLTLPRKDP